MGISGAEYTNAFCNPKVKVGNEYVVKGQTVPQVVYSLGALTKGMYIAKYVKFLYHEIPNYGIIL